MVEELTNDALLELLTLTVETDHQGTILYYNSDGKLHRNHGPAKIRKDGQQTWYRDGKRHRDNDNPAIVEKDGFRAWYQNGKFINSVWLDENE